MEQGKFGLVALGSRYNWKRLKLLMWFVLRQVIVVYNWQKAVEEFQEDPQMGSDQSQKKHKTEQGKETMNKESSQSEEAPKENYIHMRARRGQATNSHSLAERVTTLLPIYCLSESANDWC